jgi:hypothetical protein
VTNSTQGDLLRFGDPQWVEKLAQGTRCILWGIVVALVSGLIGSVLSRAKDPFLGQVIGIAGGLLGLYGAWLLTEPDPSGINEGRYVTARKLVRAALAAGLLAEFFQLVVERGHLHPLVTMGVGVIMAAAGLLGIVGEFARLYYLELLARRIPDDKLAGRARFLRWAYGISMAVVTVVGIVFVIGSFVFKVQPSPGLMIPFGCVGGIAAIAILVFGLMYLSMLVKFSKSLRVQAALARQNWTEATAMTRSA